MSYSLNYYCESFEKFNHTKATSTCKELIGFLSIFYLLEEYTKLLGNSTKNLTLEIILDSKAAKLIRNRRENDDYNQHIYCLDPDMDIDYEISHTDT